ncbi:hypothetical protein DFN06_003410 [Clostridium beijerinckii]|nr:hypothetical protein [Clostridium beijerinckii]
MGARLAHKASLILDKSLKYSDIKEINDELELNPKE